jgi:subtilisin family serine protease
MAFFVTADSAYNWRLITNGSGHFDLWSFDMLATGLPNSGVFPDIVKYRLPDLTQTMVSSFTCSDKVISVGEYINRDHYTDANGIIQSFPFTVGSHTSSSSQGPTRDGRIKPDISATGLVTLSCAVLADVPWFLANAPNKLAAGAKHIRDGGTSSASPAVAGIAALYLEKNPNANYFDVKNAIITCAKKDNFTGNNLPDNVWGYGKADAFATLTGCSTAIAEPDFTGDVNLYCYPNPAQDQSLITFNFSDSRNAKVVEIKITDATGRVVRHITLSEQHNTYLFDKKDLGSGMYYYTLIMDGHIRATKKLILL